MKKSMPDSITKNTQDHSKIKEMFHKAFPTEQIKTISELKDGYFNVAYKIETSERKMVLKIAPAKTTAVMTYEKNIMAIEVEVMGIVAERTEIPVAKVLYYDNSHSLCDADFFFMEFLEGENFADKQEKMTADEQAEIHYQIGYYTRLMNQICGELFGYYGQPEKQGSNWYRVFRSMLEDIYSDARRKDVLLPVSEETILELYDRRREVFEKVTTPRLVHWDIWAGNVFLKDNKVSGIIDFERCLWGDELMEVGFRTYGFQQAFFDGYGMQALDEEQKCRAKWYDIYLFLINSLESDYRGYTDPGISRWGSEMLAKWVEEIRIIEG